MFFSYFCSLSKRHGMKATDIIINGTLQSRIYYGKTVEESATLVGEYKSVYIVCDDAVSPIAARVKAAVGAKCLSIKEIHASEALKNMDTVLDICKWLLDSGADRETLLVAVGGGITSDMAGFAASIYKRGIRFGYIPTTLLAQVDAAIGGKTGVNFLDYKNMIGIIRQPVFTYECPEVLETLPYRAFISGTAELVKSFILADSRKYEESIGLLGEIYRSQDRASAIRDRRERLLELIGAAAAVKAGVVSRDPYEKGERKILNLGHSFAHAIERRANMLKDRVIDHGEAVAMGIVLAARLSESCGYGKGLSDKIVRDFESCGLPTKSPYEPDTLVESMEKDKKAEGKEINFVLIREIGTVGIVKMGAREAANLLKI